MIEIEYVNDFNVNLTYGEKGEKVVVPYEGDVVDERGKMWYVFMHYFGWPMFIDNVVYKFPFTKTEIEVVKDMLRYYMVEVVKATYKLEDKCSVHNFDVKWTGVEFVTKRMNLEFNEMIAYSGGKESVLVSEMKPDVEKVFVDFGFNKKYIEKVDYNRKVESRYHSIVGKHELDNYLLGIEYPLFGVAKLLGKDKVYIGVEKECKGEGELDVGKDIEHSDRMWGFMRKLGVEFVSPIRNLDEKEILNKMKGKEFISCMRAYENGEKWCYDCGKCLLIGLWIEKYGKDGDFGFSLNRLRNSKIYKEYKEERNDGEDYKYLYGYEELRRMFE